MDTSAPYGRPDSYSMTHSATGLWATKLLVFFHCVSQGHLFEALHR